MYSHSNHPYHLVDYSPWPLMASIGIMTSVSGLVKWFHYYEMNLFLLGNLILLITILYLITMYYLLFTIYHKIFKTSFIKLFCF